MANSALKGVNTKATRQTERTPGRTDEVKNNAGGFVFKVSDEDRLMRFLILGTEGGTYYVGQKQHTNDAVAFLTRMVKSNERLVLDKAVEVSTEGRAFSNSPALFAVAFALTNGQDKAAARAALSKVARTATHLYEVAEYIENLGGWGRAKRGAVADWFTGLSAESLAYQAVKYRQRNGWTMRDLMRLSHPKGVEPAVGQFILSGKVSESAPAVMSGFAAMQAAGTEKEVLSVLSEYKNLPWETIPTQFLKSEKVWKTLFYNGQLKGQAQVRNIVRLARLGAFKDMQFAADFGAALTDVDMLRKTRLHPVNLLNASVVYAEGQRDRSGGMWSYGRRKDWTNSSVIADAIDEAFHLSFKTVEPAGRRTMLAIDVSGSMASPAMGLDLSCAQVAGAVAMTVARTEPAHEIRGFTTGSSGYYGWGRGAAKLTDLGITARTSLATAMRNVQKNNFGATDCSQPMLWALENNVEVDTFVVITDNETYAGSVKPSQALKNYRNKTGIDARLAVLGTAGSEFTIADPTDRGMMDFVGFDSNAPKALADFSAGRI